MRVLPVHLSVLYGLLTQKQRQGGQSLGKPGKPGKVREFKNGQGKVREKSGKIGKVGKCVLACTKFGQLVLR